MGDEGQMLWSAQALNQVVNISQVVQAPLHLLSHFLLALRSLPHLPHSFRDLSTYSVPSSLVVFGKGGSGGWGVPEKSFYELPALLAEAVLFHRTVGGDRTALENPCWPM